MNNADYVEWVKTLTTEQLLDEVMVNAEYLTDGYYYTLGKALIDRYEELKKSSSLRWHFEEIIHVYGVCKINLNIRGGGGGGEKDEFAQ